MFELNPLQLILRVILPIILATTIFDPKTIELPIINVENDNDKAYIHVPHFADLNERNHPFIRLIRNIFSVPFDLKYYVITIQDVARYEGQTGEGMGYDVYLDKEKIDFLEVKSSISTEIRTDEPRNITLVTNLYAGKGTQGSKVSFTVDFKASVRPSYFDFLAGIILFFFAWNTIAFLLRDIWSSIIEK